MLVFFFKIGDLDEEIGNPLGLATGVLVVAACLVIPGGLLKIFLCAIGGLALLTIVKMARSHKQ